VGGGGLGDGGTHSELHIGLQTQITEQQTQITALTAQLQEVVRERDEYRKLYLLGR